jgi:hypothetical protein
VSPLHAPLLGFLLAGAALAALGCTSPARSGEPAAPAAEPLSEARAPAGDLPPVAVVELFTSEGCSSCPPADEVLGEIAASGGAGRQVFALSFHVDYWDELGWPDPFADPANTDRQRAYARAFRERGLYTPQLVVGGREGFVGSDRARARRSVDAALSRPASARVDLAVTARDGAAQARYEVAGAPPGARLILALVERSRTVEVRRGENAGRTLRHDNVVRAFQSVSLDDAAAGSVTLAARPGTPPRPDALAVIGYVQRPTLEIVGAAEAAVAPAAAP